MIAPSSGAGNETASEVRTALSGGDDASTAGGRSSSAAVAIAGGDADDDGGEVDVDREDVDTDAGDGAYGIDFDPDPQAAFTNAKRLVALTPMDVDTRKERLTRVGDRFHGSVMAAFEGFPAVELQVDGVTMFSPEDIARIEMATELQFVNVGGHAGGVKAVHKRRGLFLKFAFD